MQEIVLIIPCFNEEKRIPESAILEYLTHHSSINMLFVNDGSTDNTATVIDTLAAKMPLQIDCLHLSGNTGKAEAVRQGFLKAHTSGRGIWLGYWDADMSTPLSEIERLLGHAREGTQMLMCSRIRHLGATIERHLWRHLGGRIMATLLSILLELPVYDTQCGAKLIHRDFIESAFTKPFLSKWLFDVEIMFRLKNTTVKPDQKDWIIEVPVRAWKDVKGSKLRIQHIIRSLFDVIRLYLSYRWLQK